MRFNGTFNAFRFNCFQPNVNFEVAVCFKLESKQFYNKTSNSVETSILLSEVKKMLNIKFQYDFNKRLIVFKVMPLLQM